ncbi:DUF362 domain-containing protein [Patescibacteria group bacterium]
MSDIWSTEDLDKVCTFVQEETKGLFRSGGQVAVKLHMGERGGQYYLDPEIAQTCVVALKRGGYQPFLFDSPVIYPGGRMTASLYKRTAAKHGYTESKIGCPIKISDKSVPVKIVGFEYGVCQDIAGSDGLFVLTHVKGHECTGMGGAIKNLGMGAVDKKTKGGMHSLSKPVQEGECRNCGVCKENCPNKSIKILGREFNIKGPCFGCGICIVNCPEEILAAKDRRVDQFIAQAAAAVVSSVPAVYGVNVMKKIVKNCDCYTGKLPQIAPDVGFAGGRDLAALDKTSVELIARKAGEEVFAKTWKKSPYLQIEEFKERLK